MQITNHKSITKETQLRYVPPVLSLLLLAFFPQVAKALLLQIDPSHSEIRSIPSIPFCLFDPSGKTICPEPPPPQTFTMTGRIDANVIHQHFDFGTEYPVVERDLLNLSVEDLSTDAQYFYLTGALALLSGKTFEERSDPCFLFVGPGSCSGWGFPLLGGPGDSDGTWDGHTLTWSGNLPAQIIVVGYDIKVTDSFNFTITATAVPEPGTLSLLLLMLPLMYFGTVGNKTPFSRKAPSQ